MKCLSFLLVILSLTSCSMFTSESGKSSVKPLSFHDKRNCAPKAYAFMNKRDEAREKKITLYEYNQLQTRTVDYFVEKEADLQSCYKDTSHEYYACAVIGINSKAKIDFLDVSDEVNKLDVNLKNCLEEKFKNYNYKTLKAKDGTKFTIPLKFTAKKPS